MKTADYLQIVTRLAMRQVMKLCWVFPVQKNRILLESYNGASYSCNPKYLSEYLETQHAGEYELVWSLEQPDSFPMLAKEHHVRTVRRHSLQWFYQYLTAGVRVTNFPTQKTYFPKRKSQLVINTWHAGGAYKRTGIISEHVQGNNGLEKWRRREQAGQIDLFLSSSPVFTETNIRAAYNYTGKVLNSGLPRNDVFFDASRVKENAEKIRKKYDITDLIVLYAPTYRGSTTNTKELPPFPTEAIVKGIKARYGCSLTILSRAHYLDRHLLSADGEKKNRPRVIDVTKYPDMQELLCAADILVTDYSSSIWDYALLGRPVLLYVPDLELYEAKDRGFFTPISEWPGIVCRDEKALYDALCSLDEEACREKAKKHLEQFQSYECGKACEITEQAIRYFIQTGELK